MSLLQSIAALRNFLEVARVDPKTVLITIEFDKIDDAGRAKFLAEREFRNLLYVGQELELAQPVHVGGIPVKFVAKV